MVEFTHKIDATNDIFQNAFSLIGSFEPVYDAFNIDDSAMVDCDSYDKWLNWALSKAYESPVSPRLIDKSNGYGITVTDKSFAIRKGIYGIGMSYSSRTKEYTLHIYIYDFGNNVRKSREIDMISTDTYSFAVTVRDPNTKPEYYDNITIFLNPDGFNSLK